jgi:hypothetical protein
MLVARLIEFLDAMGSEVREPGMADGLVGEARSVEAVASDLGLNWLLCLRREFEDSAGVRSKGCVGVVTAGSKEYAMLLTGTKRRTSSEYELAVAVWTVGSDLSSWLAAVAFQAGEETRVVQYQAWNGFASVVMVG